MKRSLLLLLLPLLALSSWAKGYEIDGLFYILNRDTKTATVTYGGEENPKLHPLSPDRVQYFGIVDIPDSITYGGVGYSVTSIGECAFYQNLSLQSVHIPKSVTKIGEYAFSECEKLGSLGILNLGKSVTSIEKYAFYGCTALTTVQFPSDLTSIGECAFYGCGLKDIYIPPSVTSIGKNAFYHCADLKFVRLNGDGIVSKSYSDSFNLQHIFGNQVQQYTLGSIQIFELPEGLTTYTKNAVTRIGDYAFYGCTGSVDMGNAVESIGAHAFHNCKGMTGVYIPNSVTSIGACAFDACGLKSVTIPNSVKSIGNHAFLNCTSLRTVRLGNSVTSIGEGAFYNCPIDSITIPNSVTSIGDDAFKYCHIKKVTIGNSVERIGKGAFSYCDFERVTIPSSVTSIGEEAFGHCVWLCEVRLNSDAIVSKSYSESNGIKAFFGEYTYVEDYLLGSEISGIGDYAFSGSRCERVIPTGDFLERIGNYAFSECSKLVRVGDNKGFLPNSVKEIGKAAFYGCTNMKTISLPVSLDYIGDSAFKSCGLTNVYAMRGDPFYYHCNKNAFGDNIGDNNLITSCTLNVPTGRKNTYASYYEPWMYFSKIVEVSWLGEGDASVLATNVTLSATSLTLTSAGQTATLTATVTPSNATNKNVTWRSSNTNVATVSSVGVVTAVANGTATITATTADGTNKSASCAVTVSIPEVVGGTFYPVSRVSEIVVGKEYMIYNSAWSTGEYSDRWGFVYDSDKIAIYGRSVPESFQTSDKSYLWIFEDAGSGKYYVKNVGTGHYAGTGTTMSTTPVTYTIANFVDCPNKSNEAGSRSDDGTRIDVGNITTADNLFYIYNGEKYWNGDDYWMWTNPGHDGFTTWADAHPYAIYDIQKVEGPDTPILATGIILSQTSLTLTGAGQTATLTATVTPSNATNKSVSWSSSNTNVATVSNNGVVTAVANGTATITAATADGSNLIATCAVVVMGSTSAEEVKGYFRSASGDGYLSFLNMDANLQCGTAKTEATIKASTSYTNRYTICLNRIYIHLGSTAHFTGNTAISAYASPYIYKVENPTAQTIRAHRVKSLSEIYNGGYYVIMGYAKKDSQWYMMSSENIFNKYPGLAGLLYSATDPGESIEFAAYSEHGPIWKFESTSSTGVETQTVYRRSTDNVYTPQGQRITDARNLPAGVYIINGKKTVIK